MTEFSLHCGLLICSIVKDILFIDIGSYMGGVDLWQNEVEHGSWFMQSSWVM
jgi:hypothetical protein